MEEIAADKTRDCCYQNMTCFELETLEDRILLSDISTAPSPAPSGQSAASDFQSAIIDKSITSTPEKASTPSESILSNDSSNLFSGMSFESLGTAAQSANTQPVSQSSDKSVLQKSSLNPSPQETVNLTVLDTNAIVAALNSGKNVTVSVDSTTTPNGDLILNDAILKTSGGSATLTLLAENNIILNASIISKSESLNIILSFK